MLIYTKSFILGVIAAFAALFLEIIVSLAFPENIVQQQYFENFTLLLLLVVFIEEFFKAFLVLKSLLFVNKKKLITNSLILGLGFGLTELIFKNIFQKDSSFLIFLPAFIIHLLTCFIAGFIFSQKNGFSKKWFFLVLLINILIHITYNLIIIYLF
jgi:RsiW-degrading membrane proteinase PrsW (M82 family)